MPSPSPPAHRRRRVPVRPWVLLLVDDEPDILESVGDLVEHEMPGVTVLRARSGRDGLDLLQRERVDGIIADFNMGDMDGLQFLCIARQCHPMIPRVMLTAFPDPSLTYRAETDAGVQAFVPKVVSAEQLLDHVQGLLTYTPRILPTR